MSTHAKSMSSFSYCSSSESSRRAISLDRLDDDDTFFILCKANHLIHAETQ